ncbi:MAG: HEAT repeat domain-containing protein [Thermodesulfobacteriota bacterium]
MKKQESGRRFSFFFAYPQAVAAGLLACHATAALWIWSSNRALLAKVQLLSSQGFTVVPNEAMWPLLGSFWLALKSAFFFTLSIGAGLSLFFGFWAWLVLGKNPGRFGVVRAVVYAIPAVFLVIALNLRGFVPYPSLIVLCIASAVAAVSLWRARRSPLKLTWLTGLLFVAPIVVSAVLWMLIASSLGKHIFDNLRDDVLLQSKVGVTVNDLYYRYTLYAAEPFKTLGQKQEKTAVLSDSIQENVKASLTRALATADYVVLKAQGPADLVLALNGQELSFIHNGETKVTMPLREFVQRPLPSVGKFHDALDRYPVFRLLTLTCLVLGFPLLWYYYLYGAFCFALTRFLNQKAAMVLAGVLCLVMNLGLWFPLERSVKEMKNTGDPKVLMASENPSERIAGLRNAIQMHEDVCGLPAFQKLLNEGNIAERRWAVKALGSLPCADATTMLTNLLADSNPNVVCLAMHSLKARGESGLQENILSLLKTSPHWYVQWYAYQTAKGMGWNQ